MAEKLLEQGLSDDLKKLLRRGIDELMVVAEPFEAGHVVKLEKLTRVYSVLMADLRETVKHGLLATLDDEELEGLSDE